MPSEGYMKAICIIQQGIDSFFCGSFIDMVVRWGFELDSKQTEEGQKKKREPDQLPGLTRKEDHTANRQSSDLRVHPTPTPGLTELLHKEPTSPTYQWSKSRETANTLDSGRGTQGGRGRLKTWTEPSKVNLDEDKSCTLYLGEKVGLALSTGWIKYDWTSVQIRDIWVLFYSWMKANSVLLRKSTPLPKKGDVITNCFARKMVVKKCGSNGWECRNWVCHSAALCRHF